MKQKYIPYWKWECFKSGMWDKVNKQTEDQMLKKAIEFTSNHIEYGKAMNDVVFKWRYTMINHLTNKSINRRAFLGHCAVCYKFSIPEYIVRKAWKYLTDKQQKLADLEAEKNIKLWEIQYKKSMITSKHGNQGAIKMGYQMKFQFN